MAASCSSRSTSISTRGTPGARLKRRENLAGVTAPWYVAAGWALDLFLGAQTREHDDLEIGVPRSGSRRCARRSRGFEFVVIGDGKAWPLTEDSLARYRQTWVSRAEWPVAGRRDA